MKELKTVLFMLFVTACILQCEPRYRTHPNLVILRSCGTQVSGNSSSAGTISQQEAKCRYDVNTGLYYQSITWGPPSTSSLQTSSYMVKFASASFKRLCFRFNASVHMFKFDKSAGFRPGRYYR